MRTIKFRGKDSQSKWHYGYLVIRLGLTYIFEEIWEYYRDSYVKTDKFKEIKVLADTIDQFTELYDKYDNEIYEDDIIVWTIYHADFDGLGVLKKDIKYKGVVKWHQGGFVLKNMEGDDYYSISNLPKVEDFEIIGNIHDNPELLKEDYKNDNEK